MDELKIKVSAFIDEDLKNELRKIIREIIKEEIKNIPCPIIPSTPIYPYQPIIVDKASYSLLFAARFDSFSFLKIQHCLI